MVADLPNFRLEGFEVQEGLRFFPGVPQQGGGVEEGHDLDPAFLKPLPVLLGDFEVLLDDPHGGDAAQADDDLGLE